VSEDKLAGYSLLFLIPKLLIVKGALLIVEKLFPTLRYVIVFNHSTIAVRVAIKLNS